MRCRSVIKRVPSEFDDELKKFKATLGISSDAEAMRQMAQFSKIGRTMTSILNNPVKPKRVKRDNKDPFGGI